MGKDFKYISEIGKAIARGEEVEIQQKHLIRVMNGRGFTAGYKKCRQCGYETAEDFDFCPKCGMRF